MEEIIFRGGRALNPDKNNTCRTIKSQYYKVSIANFMRTASFGATGVIRKKYGSNRQKNVRYERQDAVKAGTIRIWQTDTKSL